MSEIYHSGGKYTFVPASLGRYIFFYIHFYSAFYQCGYDVPNITVEIFFMFTNIFEKEWNCSIRIDPDPDYFFFSELQ